MMPKAIFVSAILALATGCTYDNGRDNMGGGGGGGGTVDNIAESTIDPGATLAEIEPGKGAGAFVEVSAKGVWHVYTACDTDISGYSCGWDIIVTPLGDNTITAKEGDRLEKADYLGWYGDYSVQMVTDTSYDIDGFFFEANPDGAMRVDVYLDGAPAPRFIYWVGDGALHKGSPTNPIDLTPTTL